MHRQADSRRRRIALACAIVFVCLNLPTSKQATSKQATSKQATRKQAGATIQQAVAVNNCLACHERADGRAQEVVGLHLKSSHSRFGCQECHGGDAGQKDKTLAHGGGFVGKPDRQETLNRCGRCHTVPLAQFKSSRHFPERRNIPRLDCAECHGAHTVGDPPETFGFATLCTSCHGLEYLPDLPAPVQQMLALADELRDAQRLAEWKKRVVPREFVAGRREVRRRISEIVHPTDIQGGMAKIPEILKRGEALRTMIQR